MDQRSRKSEAPRPEKPARRELSAEEKAERLALIMFAAYEVRQRRRAIRQEMLAAKRSMEGR